MNMTQLQLVLPLLIQSQVQWACIFSAASMRIPKPRWLFPRKTAVSSKLAKEGAEEDTSVTANNIYYLYITRNG